MLRKIALAVALFLALAASPARAATPEQEVVDRARVAAESMLANKRDFPDLHHLLRNAKGVLIIPSLFKAGFIVGAEGGYGVLLGRERNKLWSYPCFYIVATGSIGIQAGVQDSEMMLLVMTEKGMNALFNHKATLGADVSVAIGNMGAGVQASTTSALGADIVAFSQTRGLFGGGALEGSVITARDVWNNSYYSIDATPRGIVMEGRFANKGADSLRALLARVK